MEITRKTEISIQQTKRLVIIQPETEVVLKCPYCKNDENMIIAEQASSIFGFSRREIYRLVETGKVNFAETADGLLFICQKSLETNLAENIQ